MKYYHLHIDGQIKFTGKFETFDQADESLETGAVWIADEIQAREWFNSLKTLLDVAQ